jgi:atypical dual specificity phosphatase
MVIDEPTGFTWVEDHSLAGTGYPASRSQVRWLAKNGIRSILTLTEQPLPGDWLRGFDVKVGHVPMKDHQPPSLEDLERGVEFIARERRAGRAVAVHCLAGEGRTGCVLAAYIVRFHGVGADQAISRLRVLKPGFVERNQEKAVYDFAATRPPSAGPAD